MRSPFPLFQSHLDLAHQYWRRLVQPGDFVIDATVGNGRDTLFLCQLALLENQGMVWGFDIQAIALEKAHRLIKESLPEPLVSRVKLFQQSHSQFPKEIPPHSVKLIAYNLGYLPGGNKGITTIVQTTLASLEDAKKLIMPGGAISITCYPGHPEGKQEEEALINYMRSLSPQSWNCCYHQWLNRAESPSLLLFQNAY